MILVRRVIPVILVLPARRVFLGRMVRTGLTVGMGPLALSARRVILVRKVRRVRRVRWVTASRSRVRSPGRGPLVVSPVTRTSSKRSRLGPRPLSTVAPGVLGDLAVWDGNDWLNAGRVQGPQGPAGPEGPEGHGCRAQGPAGQNGAAGPAGQTGPAGPQVRRVSPGPAGIQGPAGSTGATGPAGPAGPVGPIGPVGPQGLIGATGPQGPEGPKGDEGKKGDGLHIAHVVDDYQQLTPIPGLDGDIAIVTNVGQQGQVPETYYWDSTSGAWEFMGLAMGPEGPAGQDGQAGAARSARPRGSARSRRPQGD